MASPTIPKAIEKRNGLKQFSIKELADSLALSAREVGGTDFKLSQNLAGEIANEIFSKYGPVVTAEQINETAFDFLLRKGYKGTAWAGRIRSAKKRRAKEKLGVLGSSNNKGSTDTFLMVGSTSKENSLAWDREKIVLSLIKDADLDLPTAEAVAEEAEMQILTANIPHITTQLIRESVHTELIRRDLIDAANKYKSFSIPRTDLEGIIGSKNNENSNIQANNPEAVNFTLSGILGKEYALSAVFSEDLGQAHSQGRIHLHDLDSPTRVYCSAHSLEYLKKYGLRLLNLQTSSGPSKHTETLSGHLRTYLASMQSFYAGALGIGYFNIFYSTHLQADLEDIGKKRIKVLKNQVKEIKQGLKEVDEESRKKLEEILETKENKLNRMEKDPISALDEKEIDAFMKQRGQEAIYDGSQNAFSRGGQTLFLDFNLHTGVPEYLKDTLAILPKGRYGIKRDGRTVLLDERKTENKTTSGYSLTELVDSENDRVLMRERLDDNNNLVQEWFLEGNENPITYADYEKTAQRFLKNLLDIFQAGDENGQPFAFPKLDLHIDENSFEKPEQRELLEKACEVASENGSTYFIFDRDEVSLAACCRLRTAIEDNYVLKHPESMRFCGFQNVTINLPHAAYRAKKNDKGNLEGFLEEVDEAMDLAMKAHLQKKQFIELLQKPGLPQWQTGMPSSDGQKYIDTNKATYIIGLIGLNEVMEVLTGKSLDEVDAKTYEEIGLKTIAHMNIRAQEYGKKYGLKVTLEESPAESASRRLAKSDVQTFPEAKKYVKGNQETDQIYYTNSVHLPAESSADLIERIEKQGMFHPAIASGAITHAFVGEEKPDPRSIYNLIQKTWANSQTAQLTISPEFSVCKKCKRTERGLADKCSECGNDNPESFYGMSRIVGYFSKLTSWNDSKKGELEARNKGNYSLSRASSPQIEIPRLTNPFKAITAITIGKDNCPLCEDLKAVTDYRDLTKGYGKNFEVASYQVDNVEGLTKAMIGQINLSQLPALIILDENSNEIFRGQTIGRNGSTIPINHQEVRRHIENYLKAQNE